MSTSSNTEQEDKTDYLTVDDSINGQTYFCCSFVDPPVDKLAHKESFMMENFIDQYAQILYLQFCKRHDVKVDADFTWDNAELYERYIDFKAMRYESLCKDYVAANGDAPHHRMFKVRGSYSTDKQANNQADRLRRTDDTSHVFVAPVGYWVPFNPPNINDIEDQEYMEKEMQTLMKKQMEQEKQKKDMFDKRRSEMKNAIKVDNEKSDAVQLLEESDEVKRRPHKKAVLPPHLKAKLQEQQRQRQENQEKVSLADPVNFDKPEIFSMEKDDTVKETENDEDDDIPVIKE